MAPDTFQVTARSPAVVALALVAISAVAYGSVRVGYFGGYIGASAHGLWMVTLLGASFVTGVVAAGALGFLGADPIRGLLVGVAPVGGLLVGAWVTVAAGYGHFDSSPAVLGGMLVGTGAVLAGVAWLVGRTAGL